ncbi:MAG: hypothetical protein Q9218_005706 [Villophora microphyllina]
MSELGCLKQQDHENDPQKDHKLDNSIPIQYTMVEGSERHPKESRFAMTSKAMQKKNAETVLQDRRLMRDLARFCSHRLDPKTRASG